MILAIQLFFISHENIPDVDSFLMTWILQDVIVSSSISWIHSEDISILNDMHSPSISWIYSLLHGFILNDMDSMSDI